MRIAFTALALFIAVGLAAQADSLSFPQPQFVNPIYDYFTRNYLSTTAMGRGNTGVAMQGGVESVLQNPASFLPDKTSIYLEMLIKPPVSTDTYQLEDRFFSPVPFGVFGSGGSLGRNVSAGFLYSLPKTVVMDNFSVPMNLGDYLLMRYPTFNLHQITANAAWHSGNLHVGLNLHNQVYYLSDIAFLRTFERIRQGKYFLRPEFGLLFSSESYNAGITVTPQQNAEWDLKYAVYDTVLPLTIGAGIAYKGDFATLTADLEYQNTNAISDGFNDRYAVKAGFEKRVRKFTYRLGYMLHPEVWHGNYKLPVNTTANADTSLWWDDEVAVPLGGYIGKNTQHFLSVGFSWHHRDGSINLALLQEVAGRMPLTQINLSLSLYLDAFRRKNFLFFE